MTVETKRPPRETAALFSDLARPYEQFTRMLGMPDTPVARWMEDNVGTGGRALDIGCGTGRNTAMLADRFGEVLGIDGAPGMIELAAKERSRPNVRYEVHDVFEVTPEEHGRFDLVLAFSFVLHVGTPEIVLPHLRALVAPRGRLLVVEPQRPPTWGERGWQADLAFMSARAAYQASGDIDDAIVALKLVLGPNWMRISEMSVPPTREEFFAQYSAALPGAVLEEGGDMLGFFTASWQAPAADPA
jgi:SAM-dependent methyltransferase